jgi:ATP-dependent Clp protease ATP-binding subunit ClpA
MKLRNPVRDMRTIKRLLTGAEAEAHQAGESVPGAEHLLLSALELPDDSARRAFERVGADPDGLRAAIAAQHADALRAIGIEPPDDAALDTGAGKEPPAPTGVFRSSASAQSAFQAASKMARSGRSTPLVGAHVVAAVADMEHGTAARALTAMGVDRGELAAAAREEAGAPTTLRPAEQ